jgi:hypothetical protein
MRLPRWLVYALMVFVAVASLAAFSWWWAQWPMNTARDFAECVFREESIAPQEWVPTIQYVLTTPGVSAKGFSPSMLTFSARDFSDFAMGRIQFRVEGVPYSFESKRGTISASPDGWNADPTWNVKTATTNSWSAPGTN